MSFEIYRTLASGAGIPEELLGVASTQYNRTGGQAITMSGGGIATLAVAAGKVSHLTVNMITLPPLLRPATYMLTTTAGERLNCVKVAGGLVVVKSPLAGTAAPTFNGTAVNANVTANELLFTGAGATNDFTGGTVYVPEIDDGMHYVVSDTVGGGVHTLVVLPPFRRAPTTGDTVRVVPFSQGDTAVKLDATTPSLLIGTLVTDKTGGHCKIEEVHLEGNQPYVLTTHPDLE